MSKQEFRREANIFLLSSVIELCWNTASCRNKGRGLEKTNNWGQAARSIRTIFPTLFTFTTSEAHCFKQGCHVCRQTTKYVYSTVWFSALL